MSLFVRIRKKLSHFTLDAEFDSGGENVALLGASGCGKSMTLKCIAGIQTPDWGRIVVDGGVLFDSERRVNVPPQKRNIGYMFQNYALFPNMTVSENIGIGVKSPKKRRDEKVAEMVSLLRLEGYENKYPRRLSGGQQQRVALARLLAVNPNLVLLDEPFSALDDFLKWNLEQELLSVLDETGKKIVFVSHNRDEVYHICDKLAIMDEGKIQAFGDKRDVFENPSSRFAALLTGCKNVSAAVKVGENRVFAVDWGVELSTRESVADDIRFVGIRAHFVRHGGTGGNAVDCVVKSIIECPFDYRVVLENAAKTGTCGRTHGSITWEIDKGTFDKLDVKPKKGDIAPVELPANNLMLLR